jgi:nucleoid-associated protein YgaU
MELSKLTILAESSPNEFNTQIQALFNPSEITIEQTINWNDNPTSQRDVVNSQHTNANPATLSVELFFDTYEAKSDVRDYTRKVAELARIETHGNMHRPPVCQLSWGAFGVFFQGTLQSITEKFTLFLPNGTPVRATLQCSFKQWRSDSEEVRRLGLQSVDVEKRHTVRRGDSLSSIAALEYHDPKNWRPIADANSIPNPRELQPGTVLRIPRLRAV